MSDDGQLLILRSDPAPGHVIVTASAAGGVSPLPVTITDGEGTTRREVTVPGSETAIDVPLPAGSVISLHIHNGKPARSVGLDPRALSLYVTGVARG